LSLAIIQNPIHQKKKSCVNPWNLKAKIVESGVKLVEVMSEESSKYTASGVLVNIQEIKILSKSNRVEMKDGYMPYVVFEVSNLPIHLTQIDGFIIKTVHPTMRSKKGVFNSHNADTTITKESGATIAYLEDSFVFQDKFAFEKLPGNWSFQLYYKECLLAEYKFTTY
ncbi:MAG TPA: hypothetical protein PKX55_12365, partial [Leptospiraceae bacterium]|nr:hypothetical protein [Leptospiraceae bacterium]